MAALPASTDEPASGLRRDRAPRPGMLHPASDWSGMEVMSGKGSRKGAAFERLSPAARRPFSIKSARIGETAYPVSERELITLPWGTLTAFSHAGVLHRQVLVVAPLSGGFPF